MKTETPQTLAGYELSAHVDIEVCFSARATKQRVKHTALR